MERRRRPTKRNKKKAAFSFLTTLFFPTKNLSSSKNPLPPPIKTMARRSHKSRTSKLVCAMLFAATFVAGRGVGVVSAQSLPQFPGEGGQSAASAAASSAAFAADNAARSAALLAQNPGGPCSAYLAQNAAYAASSAAAAAAAAGEFFLFLEIERIGRFKKERTVGALPAKDQRVASSAALFSRPEAPETVFMRRLLGGFGDRAIPREGDATSML